MKKNWTLRIIIDDVSQLLGSLEGDSNILSLEKRVSLN